MPWVTAQERQQTQPQQQTEKPQSVGRWVTAQERQQLQPQTPVVEEQPGLLGKIGERYSSNFRQAKDIAGKVFSGAKDWFKEQQRVSAEMTPEEKRRAGSPVAITQAQGEIAKEMAQDTARFGISTYEIAERPTKATYTGFKSLAEGKNLQEANQAAQQALTQEGPYYDVPFLGRLGSFQTESAARIKRGDPLWLAIGNPAVDTVLGGLDVMGIANSIAGVMKPTGAQSLIGAKGVPDEKLIGEVFSGTKKLKPGTIDKGSETYSAVMRRIFDESVANEDIYRGGMSVYGDQEVIEGVLNPKIVKGRTDDILQKLDWFGIDRAEYLKRVKGRTFKDYFDFAKQNRDIFASIIPDVKPGVEPLFDAVFSTSPKPFKSAVKGVFESILKMADMDDPAKIIKELDTFKISDNYSDDIAERIATTKNKKEIADIIRAGEIATDIGRKTDNIVPTSSIDEMIKTMQEATDAGVFAKEEAILNKADDLLNEMVDIKKTLPTEVSKGKKDIFDVQQYMSNADNKLTDNTIEALIDKKLYELENLQKNADGTYTVYRDGPVLDRKPTSFSVEKKFDTQVPVKIKESDILVDTTSKKFRDEVSGTYTTKDSRKLFDDVLKHWNDTEGEIIAIPNRVVKRTVTPKAKTPTKVPTKKPTKAPVKRTTTKKVAPSTPSKVAVSIKEKALEKKLTKEFGDVAGYDKLSIKNDAKVATDLVENDIDRARRIIRGEESSPKELKNDASLIVAMEEHIKDMKDLDEAALLARELANSPLVAETSKAAQTLRVVAERDQSSAVKQMQEIAKENAKRLEEKTGKSLAKAQKEVVDDIKKKVKQPIPTKKDWSNFIESIKC